MCVPQFVVQVGGACEVFGNAIERVPNASITRRKHKTGPVSTRKDCLRVTVIVREKKKNVCAVKLVMQCFPLV